jgi:nucleoid-associated protein YgaU
MTASIVMLDKAVPVHQAELLALIKASGAKAWAFYLGGAGHFHDRSQYTKESLDAMAAAGLHLVPIWVGEQKNLSRARGVADATNAIQRTKAMGNRSTLLVADVERRASDPNKAAAVAYMRGWTETVRKAGYKSGFYGAFEIAAMLDDSGADFIWPARYVISGGVDKNRRQVQATPRSTWPTDARTCKGIPKTHFAAPGRRAWQFLGDVALAGVAIDVSVVDAALFAAPAKKAAAPAKPATPATATGPAKSAAKKTSPTPAKPAKPAAKQPAKPAVKPAVKPVAKQPAKPVQPPVKKAAKAPAKPAEARITVRPGDTLSALERHHGLAPRSLFTANAAALDATARKHGHPNSNRGGLIFPGQVLVLPARR